MPLLLQKTDSREETLMSSVRKLRKHNKSLEAETITLTQENADLTYKLAKHTTLAREIGQSARVIFRRSAEREISNQVRQKSEVVHALQSFDI